MSSTKEKIINTAIKLFAQQSAESCPISLLTKSAKVSTGSFYTYFASKEEFIREVLALARDRLNEYTNIGYNDDIEVKENFTCYMSKVIEYFLSHEDEFRFVCNCVFSPVMRPSCEINVETVGVLAKILAKGKAQGCIKNLPDHLLVAQVFGGSILMVQDMLSEEDPSSRLHEIQRYQSEIIEMIWHAIRA